MMETLMGLGLKSLLIAGMALLLLHLTRRRSAADRSWIAHLGLFALVALPLASLALPALSIELPAATQVEAPAPQPATMAAELVDPPTISTSPAIAETPAIDWAPYAYAVPALALLLATLVALLRLFGLRGRAHVLVDPVWLSALAHAQRRMGVKPGTALLTSSELRSPISWGLMRPVILINEEALGASGEAEAIIAHELAHVARLDWTKLMLARVATAIFWFNPLVWVLAREAHQLREEAADDAVLGADIADTDYAQLLVGVARHECRGLLIGAHGISPGKRSLRRRVSRVLDASLARGPGGRSWVAGFAAGMLVMAAPLAALTLAPKPPEPPQALEPPRPQAMASRPTPHAPQAPIAPMASAIATTVSTAVSSSLIAAAEAPRDLRQADDAMPRQVQHCATPTKRCARIAPTLAPMSGSKCRCSKSPPITSLRSPRTPQFLSLNEHEMIKLRIKGFTPQLVSALAEAGYANETVEAIGAAAIMGITASSIGDYARVGPRRSLADLTELRVMGVAPDYIAHVERSGRTPLTKNLIEMRLLGTRPDDRRRTR